MRSRFIDPEDARLHANAHELALVGEISLLLSREGELDDIEAALQRIGTGTGADASELFLAAPDGSEAFMVSHLGADTEAFCQQDRFQAGEGFPGIVLRTASALWTRSLPTEVDFVRSRIKALDYRCAICVPLRHGGVVGGCILLAWKNARSDLSRLVRTATLVSRPMAVAVELARARLLGRNAAEPPGGVPGSPDLADRLRAAASADSAAFMLLRPTGVRGRGETAPEGCPTCRGAEVQVLGGRTGWPRQCLDAGCAAKARYCVPFVAVDTVWGVATVVFKERAPVPLTRHLPDVLWLAKEFAPPSPAAPPAAVGPTASRPQPLSHHLQVQCLGRFQVLVDGVLLDARDFGRAKSRELLAMLVAAAGRPVTGEELREALWPGAEPALARNRLHVTLSALRSVVDPAEGSSRTHIRRDGPRYALDPRSSVSADLWRFQELLGQAATALSQRRPEEELTAALEAAIGLYEGDPFGGEFQDGWGDAVAIRGRREVLWAVEHLVALQCRSGDLQAAVATLRRAEEIDPLREDVRRQLMQLLMTLGRPAESAECYRRLAETLATTLGTAPSGATVRLHEALQASL